MKVKLRHETKQKPKKRDTIKKTEMWFIRRRVTISCQDQKNTVSEDHIETRRILWTHYDKSRNAMWWYILKRVEERRGKKQRWKERNHHWQNERLDEESKWAAALCERRGILEDHVRQHYSARHLKRQTLAKMTSTLLLDFCRHVTTNCDSTLIVYSLDKLPFW